MVLDSNHWLPNIKVKLQHQEQRLGQLVLWLVLVLVWLLAALVAECLVLRWVQALVEQQAVCSANCVLNKDVRGFLL
jgi:hypothetical protein